MGRGRASDRRRMSSTRPERVARIGAAGFRLLTAGAGRRRGQAFGRGRGHGALAGESRCQEPRTAWPRARPLTWARGCAMLRPSRQNRKPNAAGRSPWLLARPHLAMEDPQARPGGPADGLASSAPRGDRCRASAPGAADPRALPGPGCRAGDANCFVGNRVRDPSSPDGEWLGWGTLQSSVVLQILPSYPPHKGEEFPWRMGCVQETPSCGQPVSL